MVTLLRRPSGWRSVSVTGMSLSRWNPMRAWPLSSCGNGTPSSSRRTPGAALARTSPPSMAVPARHSMPSTGAGSADCWAATDKGWNSKLVANRAVNRLGFITGGRYHCASVLARQNGSEAVNNSHAGSLPKRRTNPPHHSRRRQNPCPAQLTRKSSSSAPARPASPPPSIPRARTCHRSSSPVCSQAAR